MTDLTARLVIMDFEDEGLSIEQYHDLQSAVRKLKLKPKWLTIEDDD